MVSDADEPNVPAPARPSAPAASGADGLADPGAALLARLRSALVAQGRGPDGLDAGPMVDPHGRTLAAGLI